MSVELSSIPIDVSFMMAMATMGNPGNEGEKRRLQKWLLHIEAISRALLDLFDSRPPAKVLHFLTLYLIFVFVLLEVLLINK